jgi:hypothetical protein
MILQHTSVFAPLITTRKGAGNHRYVASSNAHITRARGTRLQNGNSTAASYGQRPLPFATAHDLLRCEDGQAFQHTCNSLLAALRRSSDQLQGELRRSPGDTPPTADLLAHAEHCLMQSLNLASISSVYQRHPQREWGHVAHEANQRASSIVAQLRASIEQYAQDTPCHQRHASSATWTRHPRLTSLFLEETAAAVQDAQPRQHDPLYVAVTRAKEACVQSMAMPFTLHLSTSMQPRHLSRADLWDLLGSCPDAALRQLAFTTTFAVRAAELADRMSKLARARHALSVQHGQRSWAHRQLRGSVVGGPEAALGFLCRLLAKLQPAVRQQAASLAAPEQPLQASTRPVAPTHAHTAPTCAAPSMALQCWTASLQPSQSPSTHASLQRGFTPHFMLSSHVALHAPLPHCIPIVAAALLP